MGSHPHEALLKTHYFISPRYQRAFDHDITKVVYDTKDILPAWLARNALPSIDVKDIRRHHHTSRLFIGRHQGTACHILTHFVDIGSHPQGIYDGGPYHRVVQVQHMPADRSLPLELFESLRSLEYVQAATNEHKKLVKHMTEYFKVDA